MSGVNLYLNNHQFYPGSTITGKAVCNFRSSKEVRKIRIRLTGDESTHWTCRERYYDGVQKTRRTRTVSYNGYRDFLLREHIVQGEGTMDTGEHVFPFEFLLPGDLPSSFQHNYGRIKYLVTVTVDRPLKKDYESEKEITLISPIKLQSFSVSLLEPIQYSDEKSVCCFCCTSGPVQLDVNLEKRAFIVGENADLKVYCLNMSNATVNSIVAEIKMKLRFKTTRPVADYKYDSELVSTSRNSGVGAHGEKTLNLSLEIPSSTVVPNFNGCELFSCETQLKVSAGVSGCHTDVDIITDVALGHVPYRQAPSIPGQYEQTAPSYPFNEIQPMPMPMPMPGYGTDVGATMGVPPYPLPAYSLGPSAPQEIGAPSAPLKLRLGENPADLGAGNSYAGESPPPTYDEAAKI